MSAVVFFWQDIGLIGPGGVNDNDQLGVTAIR